ncbi:MAG: HAMP domain-containing sensor histidine kinase [Actinomycetota bacterium]
MTAIQRATAAAGVVGAVATVGVSMALGRGPAGALGLAGWAVGAAAMAGLMGAALLAKARHRSIAVQLVVVSLTTVGAVAAGTLVAARGMYFAAHDLPTLAVVILAGGTVGVVVALLLGEQVARGSRSLLDVVRRIGEPTGEGDGDGDGDGQPGGRPAPHQPAGGELASLAAELAEMSARLEEARAAERALESSRRELVAWVSHDLRTPLAAIRAITEALEDGVVDQPSTVARYHRTLRQEADRLAELVDDLFELSRIQAGALRLQLERSSLTDLVSDALSAAGPVASAKGVHLEGRLTDEPPPLLLSAPEVSRVLRNLLENAIRHTPSDGTVWVEAGVEQGSAYVSVADGCGGIEPAHLPRVFDLAFRGEDARTPADGRGGGSGGGLGLAIAKGLVDAHRGQIVVANEGPGCRFTVRLPMAPRA